MDELPDGAADALQQYIDTHHEFLSWLGVTVEELERGRAVMAIPYDRKLTNVPWTGAEDDTCHPIQGGVAATLTDTAGGMALRGELDDPLTAGMATINLNVNYLEAARGDLTATAEVTRAGKTVGVSKILLESERDGETTPVALATGAYRLFRA